MLASRCPSSWLRTTATKAPRHQTTIQAGICRHAAWLSRNRSLAHLTEWVAASQRQQAPADGAAAPNTGAALQALAAETATNSPQILNAYSAVVRYCAQVSQRVDARCHCEALAASALRQASSADCMKAFVPYVKQI